MHALNAKSIIRGDLKPQHILLKFHSKYLIEDKKGIRTYPKPDEIQSKITDFGFARFLSSGTMAKTMYGSPMYTATNERISLEEIFHQPSLEQQNSLFRPLIFRAK